MLKHVQISPMRNRADSVSLRSSISCSSSLCGSPEPLSDLHSLRTVSRASSYSSLNEMSPQTTIKIFTSCLRVDIEYKTLGIQWETTAQEVVRQVLRRCKMRHRDPRLFYLSMEVTIRKAGVKTQLKLEEEARPALLQACHPKGDSRFCLQMKPGGLVRVHTSALQPTSQYKSLVIAEETTSDELLGLLLSTYNSIEPIEQFSLYEVCPGQEYQRKLHPDDLPLRALQQRTQKGETCHFLVRRNPNYPRRRQLLPPINESGNLSASSCASLASTVVAEDAATTTTTTVITTAPVTDDEVTTPTSCTRSGHERASLNGSEVETPTTESEGVGGRKRLSFDSVCYKCRNNFKSCEFCQLKTKEERRSAGVEPQQETLEGSNKSISRTTYNPVYNIREIRTVCHSFSSLGIDKKLLDIQINHQQQKKRGFASAMGIRRRSMVEKREMKNNDLNNNNSNKKGSFINYTTAGQNQNVTVSGGLPPEQVNANGKFLYI